MVLIEAFFPLAYGCGLVAVWGCLYWSKWSQGKAMSLNICFCKKVVLLAWRPISTESAGIATFRATLDFSQMVPLYQQRNNIIISLPAHFLTYLYSLNKENTFILVINYPILNQKIEGVSIIPSGKKSAVLDQLSLGKLRWAWNWNSLKLGVLYVDTCIYFSLSHHIYSIISCNQTSKYFLEESFRNC